MLSSEHRPPPLPLAGEGWGEGDAGTVLGDPHPRPIPAGGRGEENSALPLPLAGEGWGEGEAGTVLGDPHPRPLPARERGEAAPRRGATP